MLLPLTKMIVPQQGHPVSQPRWLPACRVSWPSSHFLSLYFHGTSLPEQSWEKGVRNLLFGCWGDIYICITDPDGCHLFKGYEFMWKTIKQLFKMTHDRWSGKTCAMIAFTIIISKKRVIELAFVWPSSSWERSDAGSWPCHITWFNKKVRRRAEC